MAMAMAVPQVTQLAGALTLSLPLISISITLMLVGLPHPATTFNYSPRPSIIINAPSYLKFFKPQARSSYFGYTLVMRSNSIFVGAPRAQSTLAAQRNVNETGAIYRCSLVDTTCAPYVLDDKGNRIIENSEYTYDSERRDNQWLGAVMDGGTRDTDKLLVCAPRFIAPAVNDYLMHGICYWINDTLSRTPANVRIISPLRLKQDQIKEHNGQRFYYYMLAEQGLSGHVSDDNEEILIGAPGIHTWKGSVIRYRKKIITVDPSLSRRDTAGVRVTRQIDAELPQAYYESEVPNPEKWGQLNDSYFGYAVASGHFDSNDLNKTSYVATAPQANEQSGEAYVFDIAGSSILKHFVFRGKQFGEYFGYAVLAEDLNNDGLTDVIVSAPQHSISGSFDDGAIYVFINMGRFNFERKVLTSPAHGKARFGTTLSRLGDINHDGYNDIAVGAPFAKNGSVFIYLGSRDGIRDQPSQRLDSPANFSSIYGEHMFGHGLSKGSDIDGNGFNDLAVGAPNGEAVFLYRAYPVVKILATINSPTREIKPDQSSFKVNVCYGIATSSTRMVQQDVALRIVVDPQVKRVKIMQTQSNELQFNATAGLQKQCRTLDCEVRFSVADIFKPIELEMHYDLINSVPDSDVFCDTCAAVDPVEPKVYSEKIIFSTGCASDICIADLHVQSSGLDNSFILGSSRTLTVSYDVSNSGETAYLPQINITSSNQLPFAKIPSNCRVDGGVVMVCDLNRGQPMVKGARDAITVIFDVNNLAGTEIVLKAEVFSTGRELNPLNNKAIDVIGLREFTEVEAFGAPKTPHINLEEVSDRAQVINYYEIRSNGPSMVGGLEVVFHIPVAYRVPGSPTNIPIIDMTNITMQAVYDSQLVGIDFFENNTQIIMETYEYSSSSMSTERAAQMLEDTATVSHHHHHVVEPEHSLSDSVMTASMSRSRRRREAAAQTASKDQYSRIVQARAHDLLDEDLKGKLPVNRTIVFNCDDYEMTVCVRAVMRVYNFKPDKPLSITMKFNVDLKEVNQILIEPWEFYVILVGLDVSKAGDLLGNSLAVKKKIEHNIISKHQLYGTPLWIIILAIIGGLLLLALITYGMYKAGFFKRARKEEMAKLVHQNQGGADGDAAETQNLNSDSN